MQDMQGNFCRCGSSGGYIPRLDRTDPEPPMDRAPNLSTRKNRQKNTEFEFIAYYAISLNLRTFVFQHQILEDKMALCGWRGGGKGSLATVDVLDVDVRPGLQNRLQEENSRYRVSFGCWSLRRITPDDFHVYAGLSFPKMRSSLGCTNGSMLVGANWQDCRNPRHSLFKE